MKKIAVLISGQGRNLQAILDACADGRIPAQVGAVISDRADAPGLKKAASASVPQSVVSYADHTDRGTFCVSLAAAISASKPDIIALAGFMRVLTPYFVERFSGRLLNIHPSLLPKHRGLHTHRAALAAGDAEHGASVHFVSAELDGGPVVLQGRTRVRSDDTESRLAERVMHDIELKIYPQALAWLARGELVQDGMQVRYRGRVLKAPLGLDDLEPEFR